MTRMDDIAAQVQRNCTISDARYAGNYSVCGLAMRLRDLYKWEKGLQPWMEEEPAVMLEWIGRKEEEWETLAEKELADIVIEGTAYRPFDLERINAWLKSFGLYYGAGFVHGLKPTFFLAPLEEKREEGGIPILVLGRELARDLLTLPAMTQNDCILVRRGSAGLFLWNQIFFVKNSGRDALRFALETYGVNERDPASVHAALDRISGDQVEVYIHHELGEIREDAFDRSIWRELLTAFPHTPIEILVRSLKDLLVDTGEQGALRYITRQRRPASLALYAAFLDGLKKEMFSELPGAFNDFRRSGDWSLIEEAAASAYQRAKEWTDKVCAVFQQGKRIGDLKWAGEEIEREILNPITGSRK